MLQFNHTADSSACHFPLSVSEQAEGDRKAKQGSSLSPTERTYIWSRTKNSYTMTVSMYKDVTKKEKNSDSFY